MAAKALALRSEPPTPLRFACLPRRPQRPSTSRWTEREKCVWLEGVEVWGPWWGGWAPLDHHLMWRSARGPPPMPGREIAPILWTQPSQRCALSSPLSLQTGTLTDAPFSHLHLFNFCHFCLSRQQFPCFWCSWSKKFFVVPHISDAFRKLSKIETLRLASSYISHLGNVLLLGEGLHDGQPCHAPSPPFFHVSSSPTRGSDQSTQPKHICTFCLSNQRRMVSKKQMSLTNVRKTEN